MASLADALRQHGPAYLAMHTLNTPQAKAWRAIVACRRAALGGQQLACDACGHSHWQYHSCLMVTTPLRGSRAPNPAKAGPKCAWNSPLRHGLQ